ncbi:MAG: ABC transporter ATP-binding protein [Desulfovibrio sp.]
MAEKKFDIRLEDLTVGYGGKPVLSDVTVTIPNGKITVILGGSGCGKSTLLRHMLYLNKPISGEIYVGDQAMSSLTGADFRRIRQRMGVLFQDGALLGSLTLAQNVGLPLTEHTKLSKAEVLERVRAKLALVGLDEFLDYYPNELSGGMRKRAGLARAMIMDPSVLFCDEPTSGLDPVNAAELDHLLLEVCESFKMTMVVVSHDLQSLNVIADHVVVLGEGTCIFEGALDELLHTEDPYLKQFLGRKAVERDTPRLTMPPLDPSVFKLKR